MKKIALLVSGQIRYFNYANETLKLLLDLKSPEDVIDTYISTSAYDYYKMHGDDIIPIRYEPRHLKTVLNKRFPNTKLTYIDESNTDRQTSNNAWIQYTRIEYLYNEASKTDDYDIYIRIRPDTCFTKPPTGVLDIKPNEVACHIRKANYSGIIGMNDWFYVAGKEAAKKIMKAYSLNFTKTHLRGEDMLYQTLVDNKISIVEIPRLTEILPENYL